MAQAGCENARGIGPQTDPDAFVIGVGDPYIDEYRRLTPDQAAAKAEADGHTVVFIVGYREFSECWCVTPPAEPVSGGGWNRFGALVLAVRGTEEGHTKDDQPFLGWGC
jgi:hypothetical protein